MSDEPGGDPVCWLSQLCPECGAVPSPDDAPSCWRCGTAVSTGDHEPAEPNAHRAG